VLDGLDEADAAAVLAALEDLDAGAFDGLGFEPAGGDGGGAAAARRRLRDAVAALARGGHPELAGLGDLDEEELVEHLLGMGIGVGGDWEGPGGGRGPGGGGSAGEARGLDPHLPLLQLFLQTLLPWNDIQRDN
jgi:hypothetical protein